MSEPPELNYRSPSEKPHPKKGDRTIGLLGFFAYCLPAFLFDWLVIRSLTRMAMFHWSLYRLEFLAIPALIGAFCTWRAIVALLQFFG